MEGLCLLLLSGGPLGRVMHVPSTQFTQGVVATLVTKAQPPKGHPHPRQRNLPSLPGRGAPAQPVPPLLHPLGWAQGGDSDGTRGMSALSLAPGSEGRWDAAAAVSSGTGPCSCRAAVLHSAPEPAPSSR